MKKGILTLTLSALLLTGCTAGPAPAPSPRAEPTPSSAPSAAPEPTRTPSPWDTYDGAMDQITMAGFPINAPLDDLDPEFLDTLAEDTGDPYPWDGQELDHHFWRYKTYTAPGLRLVTAELTREGLDELFNGIVETDEQGMGWAQASYGEANGTEYIFAVRPLDDTYATVPGLKLGDSAERCLELGYMVGGGVNDFHVALLTLYVTVEDGIVTDLVAENGGRLVGPLYD